MQNFCGKICKNELCVFLGWLISKKACEYWTFEHLYGRIATAYNIGG